jgi:hypothetical protein
MDGLQSIELSEDALPRVGRGVTVGLGKKTDKSRQDCGLGSESLAYLGESPGNLAFDSSVLPKGPAAC